MKITIKGINIKLSPALEDYIRKKIDSLEKFLENVDESNIEAWVEVGKPSQHHRQGDVYYAEVDLRLSGKILRAEAQEWDLRVAVDVVKDELQRAIKKYKGKQVAHYRRGARILKKIKSLSSSARFWRKGRIREEGM
jgi:putative sigma-54 modulation protein